MMASTKRTFITAFALFSLFFGAGNLILPPYLGFLSGEHWWLVVLGFCLSAVLIPILGILAHARLQGTIYHFAYKISPGFSVVYCYLIYAISIALPSPRTASVTHEIAIAPFFNSPSVLTSTLYFGFVFVCVMYRSKLLDVIGKILTPAILAILVVIVMIAAGTLPYVSGESSFPNPITHGIIEGYQTFDAIGAIVVGGVVIISINLKLKDASYAEKRRLLSIAAWITGLSLLGIYAGLVLSGALMHGRYDDTISRTALLNGIFNVTLGRSAHFLLSILVGLACFTTAVGIVAGSSDFLRSRYSESRTAYTITAALACIVGIGMGQLKVDYIIAIALPVLMFIYPVTILLILLNVLPQRFATPAVFRTVVITGIVFSVPDFLGSIGLAESAEAIRGYIPLSDYSLGWFLPSLAAFIITVVLTGKR